MANFGIVVEPDPSRRAAARRALSQRIAPYPHLEAHDVEIGNTVMAWALSPEAPRRVIQRDDEFIIVIGHVVGGDPTAEPDLDRIEDGFHIVIRLTRGGRVQVRPDLLGLFPVYTASPRQGTLLVASSPWLFHAHPDFRVELEPRAVVGLLLGNTMVAGRNIHRGVKRLRSGHALRFGGEPDSTLEEVPVYEIPLSDRLHRVTAAECSDHIGDALTNACRRHLEAAGTATVSLLLSGGLDSRLLAGTLNMIGRRFRALTLGRAGDIEANCAAGVARALGVEHHIIDRPAAPDAFMNTLRWDALMSSPGTGGMWSMVETYRGYGPWLVSGYVMDTIIGGSHLELPYDEERRASGFEVSFQYANLAGFPVGTLEKLLRPEVFSEALREVQQEFATEYHGLGEDDLACTQRFYLHNRLRYHTGAPLWRHSFGSWPVAPCNDREVLETAGACPLALLSARRLESQLLLKRFPVLASLPLDRNSYRETALDPRLRDLVAVEIRERAAALGKRLTGGRWRRKERRQYHRSYNFNGPVWRAIRRSMEPHRELAYQLFDRTTFDSLLPPADGQWKGKSSIEPAAGVKSLLGIIGWLREFSPAIGRA